MRWKKKSPSYSFSPNTQPSKLSHAGEDRFFAAMHNSAKLINVPIVPTPHHGDRVLQLADFIARKMQNSQSLQWQPSQMAVKANQSRSETPQPTDFCQKSVRLQGTRQKRRLLPSFHAVPCQCFTECAEILAGRRILSGRKQTGLRVEWTMSECYEVDSKSSKEGNPHKIQEQQASLNFIQLVFPQWALEIDRIWQDEKGLHLIVSYSYRPSGINLL